MYIIYKNGIVRSSFAIVILTEAFTNFRVIIVQ